MAEHKIEIFVPLPDGSMAEKAAVMGSYEAEMKAFFGKLPAGSKTNDYFTRTRDETMPRKPRETAEEKLAKLADAAGAMVINGKLVPKPNEQTADTAEPGLPGTEPVEAQHSSRRGHAAAA